MVLLHYHITLVLQLVPAQLRKCFEIFTITKTHNYLNGVTKTEEKKEMMKTTRIIHRRCT